MLHCWILFVSLVLGESIVNIFFFQLEEALKEAFHKVQTVAVALSHTVNNQDINNGKFKVEFDNAFKYLRYVLCELETVMRDCSISVPPNVKSDIIPHEFRQLDKSTSGAFDFIVLREYIKTLNYVTKMFEYFRKNNQ